MWCRLHLREIYVIFLAGISWPWIGKQSIILQNQFNSRVFYITFSSAVHDSFLVAWHSRTTIMQGGHYVVLFVYTFHLVTHSSLAQVQGEWKTRNENMSKYCSDARALKSQFKSFDMEHVPRVCTCTIYSVILLFFVLYITLSITPFW